MKLVIATQVYENYAWDENGVLGVGDKAYWKAKGGHEYIVENVPVSFAADAKRVRAFIDRVKPEIECDSDGFREYIIDWSIEDDTFMSWFEKAQLEHEGSIRFPEPRISFEQYAALDKEAV